MAYYSIEDWRMAILVDASVQAQIPEPPVALIEITHYKMYFNWFPL